MAHNTSYSLLERALNLDDEAAWNELVKEYQGFIYYLLQRVDVHANDIEDVVQKVMVTLLRDLKNYNREKGRFRNWFSSLVRSTVKMHYRKENAHSRKVEKYSDLIDVAGGGENELDQRIEEEWEKYITERALENIKVQFRGQAIEVFELGLAGHSVRDIMSRLGLAESSVYKFKQRVKRALMLEVRALIKELEPESEGE